jgi:D-aminopeptidase
VKVFISFDMEGVAGQPYEDGRRRRLGEVKAATTRWPRSGRSSR